MKKIGILGGSFDPVHLGHLIIGEEIRIQLKLQKVLFIPAGRQGLKRRELTPAHHRLEMLSRALASNSHFEYSLMEIERPGPSFTVNTLEKLCQEDKEAELYFILGWDSLAELPTWHKPKKIIQLCYLAAVPRPDFPSPDMPALERALPGLSSRVLQVPVPLIGISSTLIRERISQGLSIRYLVPETVESYIKEQRLYR